MSFLVNLLNIFLLFLFCGLITAFVSCVLSTRKIVELIGWDAYFLILVLIATAVVGIYLLIKNILVTIF